MIHRKEPWLNINELKKIKFENNNFRYISEWKEDLVRLKKNGMEYIQ